ncbi:MAG: AI-2E family transporter [Desulfobulbaceae bacterium]|nr:AI-2E family transporter [Desulfobulbaceae bacterium]
MQGNEQEKKDTRIRGGNHLTSESVDRMLTTLSAKYFLLVFLIVTLLLGWLLWPFWQLLVLAFLLAGIFRPVHLWLCRWVSPWMASALTCTLIFFIVFVPLTFCIGALSSEALNLFHWGRDSNLLMKLQQSLQNNTLAGRAQELLAGFGINFEPSDVTRLISDLSKSTGLFIYEKASAWAANIMSFVVQFCILIMVIFFLLIEIDRLIDFLTRLSPLPPEQDKLLMNKFMEISGVILVGNGISGLLQGVLGGIFFTLLGLNSPVLWGTVMAVFAFLPIFGIGAILIPTAALLFLNGYPGQAIMTLVFYALLSFSVEYLLKPKFVGSQVKMHTLLVLLSILGGMSLFGILGIIYGPLIVTAFLTLSEIYLKEYKPAIDKA